MLVGSKKIFSFMIHNNYIAARTTNLCRFLKEVNASIGKFFGTTSTSAQTDDDDDE